MRKKDVFFLAPPLISRKGYGFIVIQMGADESSGVILDMTHWTAVDYIRFWHNELLSMLTDKGRSKGVLPVTVCKTMNGDCYFSDHWRVNRVGADFVFCGDFTINGDALDNPSSTIPPKDWWMLVEDYADEVDPTSLNDDYSEYRVSAKAVAAWCHTYSSLFNKINPRAAKRK